MEKQIDEKQVWLTVPLAAIRAGVSHDVIRKAYTMGELRCARIGGGPKARIRFREEWIDQWIEARATGGMQ